jgi:hypothetical protein
MPGSRLTWTPKADATGLAPEKSAETLCKQLAEGLVFLVLILPISVVKFRSGGLGRIQREERRAFFARRSE